MTSNPNPTPEPSLTLTEITQICTREEIRLQLLIQAAEETHQTEKVRDCQLQLIGVLQLTVDLRLAALGLKGDPV